MRFCKTGGLSLTDEVRVALVRRWTLRWTRAVELGDWGGVEDVHPFIYFSPPAPRGV